MKKLIFIALFAIGFANSTQAQCLYSSDDYNPGDFTLTPTATWGGSATFERIDNELISFVLYTHAFPNSRYVIIDGVKVNSYDSNANGMYESTNNGSGEVTVDGWVYSYSWLKDSHGYLSYLDVCIWEE